MKIDSTSNINFYEIRAIDVLVPFQVFSAPWYRENGSKFDTVFNWSYYYE